MNLSIKNNNMKDNQLEAVQLIALYTILVTMIDQKRIAIMESVSILEKAGLTTDDFDTWRSEDGREIHFPLEFPTFDIDMTHQRNDPEFVGC